MRFKKLSIIFAVSLSLLLTACTNSGKPSSDGSGSPNSPEGTGGSDYSEYPIKIEHAFGETVIEEKPENIVTISWGNQDIPLALGVVPVGVSMANYGVIDDSGLLPWTLEGFKNLGVDDPVLFNDATDLDFEAINDAQPDVILAAYSGLTQEEYDLLSGIAPVVAYPKLAWQTYWREQIILNAEGMAMKSEGEELVTELEKLIDSKISEYPEIKGKSAAFAYFNPSDLGTFHIYLPTDPRAAYLTDLGMEFPKSVLDIGKDSASFSIELSAENVDKLNDVDIIVAYGDSTVLEALQKDPLMGTIPAIERGSVVMITDGTPLAASATPSALSIPATIDEFLTLVGEAADKVK